MIELIGQALDGSPPGPIRFVSLCAGQGHDILSVAATHRRGRDLTGRLVELDPVNATAAAARIEELGLSRHRGAHRGRGDDRRLRGCCARGSGRGLRHLRQRVPRRHRADHPRPPIAVRPGCVGGVDPASARARRAPGHRGVVRGHRASSARPWWSTTTRGSASVSTAWPPSPRRTRLGSSSSRSSADPGCYPVSGSGGAGPVVRVRRRRACTALAAASATVLRSGGVKVHSPLVIGLGDSPAAGFELVAGVAEPFGGFDAGGVGGGPVFEVVVLEAEPVGAAFAGTDRVLPLQGGALGGP